MKAAVSFTLGLDPEDFENPGDARKVFHMGDEIPEEYLDDVPEEYILENVLDSDPNSLTREQLLALVGKDKVIGATEEEEEFDEEQFREALSQFNNKGDLVKWANEMFGMELDEDDGKRGELEDWITLAAQGIDPFEDDEEED